MILRDIETVNQKETPPAGVTFTKETDQSYSFRTTPTAELVKTFAAVQNPDGSFRNNMSDLQILDAQRRAVESYRQNLASRINSRQDLLLIQQKINLALSKVSQHLAETDLQMLAANPNVMEADNLGWLLVQKRVMADLLLAYDKLPPQPNGTEKNKLEQAFAQVAQNYFDWRDDVISYKAIGARKARESISFLDENADEIENQSRLLIAQMRVAEQMDNVYSDKGIDEVKKAVVAALEKNIKKQETSQQKTILNEELQDIIAYIKTRNLFSQAEIEKIVPLEYLDQYIGGVVSIKSVELPAGPAAVPETKETLAAIAHENVLYAPAIDFLGDQHGKFDKVQSGVQAVYVGDLLDIKENMYRFDSAYRSYVDGSFVADLEATMTAIEKNERQFVIGNHDMSLPLIMSALVQWDKAKNAGKPAEIDLYARLAKETVQHWTVHAGGDLVCKALGIHLTGNLEQDTFAIGGDARLQRFARLVINHGKLFTIANERLVSHTLPAADEQGNLLELEDGATGLDALSILQKRLRSGDVRTIQRLHDTIWEVHNNGKPTGTRYEHGPVWRRDKEVNVFYASRSFIGNDYSHLDNLIRNLDQQAQKYSARVKGIINGHISGEGKCDPQGKLVNIDHAQNVRRDVVGRTRSRAQGNQATFTHYDPKNKEIRSQAAMIQSV